MAEASERKARVFICCPQIVGSDEIELANNVWQKLHDLGFDPYMALNEQSAGGIVENIFQQLRNSEYFIFIDLKRESLNGKDEHRGSLFCNQELAIASFLQIPVICIREKGVKEQDGMLRFFQANPIEITDRAEIVSLIEENVIDKRKWEKHHRNELALEEARFTDATIRGSGKLGCFIQISVRNLNKHNAATGCHVLLEKIEPLTPVGSLVAPLKSLEHMWSGTPTLPYVTIGANSTREFTPIMFYHEAPNRPEPCVHTDSDEFRPQLPGIGSYRLTYAVISVNFPTARRSYDVNVGNSRETWSFGGVKPGALVRQLGCTGGASPEVQLQRNTTGYVTAATLEFYT